MKLDWRLVKAAHRAVEQDIMGEFELGTAWSIRINLLYNSKRVKIKNSHILKYEPGLRLEFISLKANDQAISRYIGHSELECESYNKVVKSLKRALNERLELRERAREWLKNDAKTAEDYLK